MSNRCCEKCFSLISSLAQLTHVQLSRFATLQTFSWFVLLLFKTRLIRNVGFQLFKFRFLPFNFLDFLYQNRRIWPWSKTRAYNILFSWLSPDLSDREMFVLFFKIWETSRLIVSLVWQPELFCRRNSNLLLCNSRDWVEPWVEREKGFVYN